MPQPTNEQGRCRKPRNQQKSVSIISNKNHASESTNSFGKESKKKKRFLFVKLKGLGCKGTPVPPSTPAIIRSAAEWEAKGSRNKNHRRKQALQSRRNPENVVVDVPDVCCTPPGIGIASDFATRTRNPAPRFDHRKNSREARRNEDDDFPAILSGGIGSRTNHRTAEQIIEMLMSQQALMSGGIFDGHDEHQGWRLDVDHMSYEELVDLSDRIGYVGTGLQEEEIYGCLRILKHFNPDSTSLLVTGQKDWKCSICQEKCGRDEDIGALHCGHHHHLQCIKQWLLQKNSCPVCKSPAMRDKSC
ncbi:hypothetical protein CDL12_03577 [Handroanthus impetiginosus]|uniref:RING-type E3 ubiquitin transferase n=1 Tax=Handroanthus impetiginosus TaxID=429701 RepID=A0A2G9I1R1_9LAMI|nr:hypothetical protein CDL12_03577 [Handroanthus impetiginosus]